MFRPSPSITSSLFNTARQTAGRRGYASAPSAGGSSSNLPLILGLGGIAGLGGYYYLGGMNDPKAAAQQATNVVQGVTGAAGALDKNAFVDFKLKEIKPYNHDSSTFVFELPDGLSSGLSVASAVVVKGSGEGVKDKDGKPVIRPYTPVTAPDTKGHIDFLIKHYQGGAMTDHIFKLQPGDNLAIKGPIPKFPYKRNEFEEIGMIAGGTAITPMWQVIQQISSDKEDKTKVTLVYTNKSEKDILLREKFDELAKSDPRFKIVYGLDQLPKGFTSTNKDAFEGYVTPELISQHMPKPGNADKIKLFVCGPPPQVEAVCGGKGPKGSQGELKGLLADAGYQPSQIYKF